MIKFIKSGDTLPVRSVVLRDGASLYKCRFPTDELEGAFHLGYYIGEELVSIASLAPQNYEGYAGNGYQLRGMATLPAYRGKGLGAQLLNFAITHLQDLNAVYLWCNARKNATKFYSDRGFKTISGEFEVPVIGPHFVMHRSL